MARGSSGTRRKRRDRRPSGTWALGAHQRIPLEAAYRQNIEDMRRWVRGRGIPDDDGETILSNVFDAYGDFIAEEGVPADVPCKLVELMRNEIRNYRRQRRHEELDDETLPKSQRDPEQALDGAASAALATSVLEDMPAQAKGILERAMLDGATVPEIAAEYDMSLPGAKSALHRARGAYKRKALARAKRWGLMALLTGGVIAALALTRWLWPSAAPFAREPAALGPSAGATAAPAPTAGPAAPPAKVVRPSPPRKPRTPRTVVSAPAAKEQAPPPSEPRF